MPDAHAFRADTLAGVQDQQAAESVWIALPMLQKLAQMLAIVIDG